MNSWLDKAEMQELGLYRISPGILGWLTELFARPIYLFLIIGGVAWITEFSHQYSTLIIFSAPALNFLSSILFLISNIRERNTNNADILYLRNYSKPAASNNLMLRDVGVVQSLVKAILRPPYDTVSFFPPAGKDPQKQRRDRRLLQRRGIPNVFTVRTRDDSLWKPAVSHLMANTRLVIVECYRIEGGFCWELRQLPKLVDPDKVILVGEKDDQSYADEIKTFLEKEYLDQNSSLEVDIPIITFEPKSRVDFQEFKNRLMATVRERAPYSDQFLQQRSVVIWGELLPRILQSVFDLAHWVSILGAFIIMWVQY